MIQYPQIDPVAIALGPLKIHWYGLMYLVGFAGAWWLGQKRARRSDSPVNAEQLSDLIFYAALGVILGGRLGYVFFYNFDQFLSDPLWALKVWEGGMSFHGGLLGVLAVMGWYSRKLNVTFFRMADFIAPLVPVGLGAGRVGNFIGAELYGRTTDVAVAMKFPIYQNIDGVRTLLGWTDPRHPSQLYQFALEGVALFCILWFFSAKPRPAAAVSGVFLAFYGIFRFIVEFARQPDQHLGFIAWDWLTMGQLLSAPMVIVGAGIVVWAYRRADD